MLNWGILGTSFISGTLADAIAKDPGSRFGAVGGRSPAALAAFQQQYGVEQAFTSYDEVIGSSAVDVVYIALPNHLHHEYVIKAAQAGKHVLCEKSLSVDMARTESALAAVERSGIFFMEGLMYLAHPLAARLVELIQSGVIGAVRSVSGQYCAPIQHLANPDSRGAIYNLGCYPASLLHLVMQTACGPEVFESYHYHALGTISEPDGNVAETALHLRFANGMIGHLHCADTHGLHAEFSVVGERGSIRLGSNPWLPTASGNLIYVTPYEGERQRISVEAEDDAFYYQVRLVRACIERGEREAPRPAPRPRDSHEIMLLLTRWEDATRRSL